MSIEKSPPIGQLSRTVVLFVILGVINFVGPSVSMKISKTDKNSKNFKAIGTSPTISTTSVLSGSTSKSFIKKVVKKIESAIPLQLQFWKDSSGGSSTTSIPSASSMISTVSQPPGTFSHQYWILMVVGIGFLVLLLVFGFILLYGTVKEDELPYMEHKQRSHYMESIAKLSNYIDSYGTTEQKSEYKTLIKQCNTNDDLRQLIMWANRNSNNFHKQSWTISDSGSSKISQQKSLNKNRKRKSKNSQESNKKDGQDPVSSSIKSQYSVLDQQSLARSTDGSEEQQQEPGTIASPIPTTTICTAPYGRRGSKLRLNIRNAGLAVDDDSNQPNNDEPEDEGKSGEEHRIQSSNQDVDTSVNNTATN